MNINVLNKAKFELSKRINLDDLGEYYISDTYTSHICFRKKIEILTKDDIVLICVNSNEVNSVMFTEDNVLHVYYTNGYEIFKNYRSIFRRKWFELSFIRMKKYGLINPLTIKSLISTYDIPSNTINIHWDQLERATKKDFKFEKQFNKPKNLITASLEA